MTALFLKLLDLSWKAGWLILAVTVLRALLRRAPKWTRCALWAPAAVRLVCPVCVESPLSLIPGGEPVVRRAAELQIQSGPGEAVRSGPVLRAADIAAAVWLAGMAALLLYALVSTLRLRRRVRAALPLGDGVWLCDAVDSPFILGVFHPRIYLPSDITGDETGHVLAHEQAHLKRRDHWWKPLGFLLLAVYWFHPLVWLAYVLFCRDMELACDEKVVRDLNAAGKKAYAETLLACSVRRAGTAACPLAFGEVGVKARVKAVLRDQKPAFRGLLAAGAACAVLAVCFLTDPAAAQPSDGLADGSGPAGSPDDGAVQGGYYISLTDPVTDPPAEEGRGVDPGFSPALPEEMKNTDPDMAAPSPEGSGDADFALSPDSDRADADGVIVVPIRPPDSGEEGFRIVEPEA